MFLLITIESRICMNNDRRKKWKELSAHRMTRILQTTELIANLSSHNYEYEDDWLKFILDNYHSKGIEIKRIFENPDKLYGEITDSEFKFPDLTMEAEIKLSPKQKKFREIGQKRMTNLFKELNYFSRLANTKNYTYDMMDVDYLFEIYDEKGIELRKWFPPFKEERIENIIKIENYPSEM